MILLEDEKDRLDAAMRRSFLSLNREANLEMTRILASYADEVTGALTSQGLIGGTSHSDLEIQQALRSATHNLRERTITFFEKYLSTTAQSVILREKSGLSLLAKGLDAVTRSILLETVRVDLLSAGITQEILQGFALNRLTLSDKLWALGEFASEQANAVARFGVLQGRDALAVSKDLEAVLVPRAGASDRIWSHANAPARLRGRVSGAPIGARTGANTVSYNYLRIARTEMFRAQRAAHIMSIQGLKRMFPFEVVKGVRWNLSTSHEIEDICDEWATADDDGLGSGIYKPENVPVGHPNDLCHTTSELIKPSQFKQRMLATTQEQWGEARGAQIFSEVLDQEAASALGFAGTKVA